jgi:hypothetical protein
MTAMDRKRELRPQWQRAAKLILLKAAWSPLAKIRPGRPAPANGPGTWFAFSHCSSGNHFGGGARSPSTISRASLGQNSSISLSVWAMAKVGIAMSNAAKINALVASPTAG